MIYTKYTNELKQFRQKVYQNFDNRADTLIVSGCYKNMPIEFSKR
jgi:hypothetical protein